MNPDNILLRDWFAGLAMQTALLSDRYTGLSTEETAECSYYMADAMLAERKKMEQINNI